ncbi:hypothetical protein NEOLEDRAFT_793973 [Neolentinus lepideus HHB14362 ss-1]|uniref:Uncharacterized protein n=1 Tax=Neolentinus lepideus HHB14362 ss-1 TaxID=1314782 RepID=A0A165PLC9_9AGAM|nr:hypothetical protein NEOLEDRAFT_793973 [Neolentinus lepideus HHB14362 ss-1]
MTDLTYCYMHMTPYDLLTINTIETESYLSDTLQEEQVEVPKEMRPPDIEESEALPSQIHPSYLYGNPFSLKHPASRPRLYRDPHSRSLFQDSAYGKGGKNDNLQWKDLALSELLPVNEVKEEADKAAQARRMASGATPGNSGGQQPPDPPPGPDQTVDEEEEDEEENDENESGGEEDESAGEDANMDGESSYDEDE